MNENQAMMLERSMRSVFVGNIPFDLTEEKLKEIFCEVGPVLSFKLVYDRENGKPKGYGFCEYKDIETANSAMRNLNSYEIGGRILKVDNAANEKSRMELQNSIMDAAPENAFDNVDPEKVPEAISRAVASLPPEQMFELMRQMKQCIQNNPNEARTMLLQNPQLAYSLLQSLVVMKIVDPEIALTMLSKPSNVPDLMNPEPRPVQPPPIKQDFMQNMNQNMGPMGMNQNMGTMNNMGNSQMGMNQNMGMNNMPPHMRMNDMPPQMGMNQNMPPQMGMNQNMPPQMGMNQNMPPQMGMNQNMPPQMGMNQNMPPQMGMNQNMPPQMGMNQNTQQQMGMHQNMPPINNMGGNDMDRPMDPRGRMMGGPPPMPMGCGDVDLRTQMPAPVMPPLPNSSGPGDQGMRDPRQPPLPVAPPRDPRGSDPRSGNMLGGPPPLPRQPPPLPKASSSQPMASNLPDAGNEQDTKAQLIKQVLQLTSEQIAMLPADQRNSILLLKEQIAKSKQR